MEDCAITSVLSKNHRVCGVETTHGAIECEYFINCAGFWARHVWLSSTIFSVYNLLECSLRTSSSIRNALISLNERWTTVERKLFWQHHNRRYHKHYPVFNTPAITAALNSSTPFNSCHFVCVKEGYVCLTTPKSKTTFKVRFYFVSQNTDLYCQNRSVLFVVFYKLFKTIFFISKYL